MPASYPFTHFNALVIEPNIHLFRPYEYLSPTFDEQRVDNFVEAQALLSAIVPDLILISASYEPLQIVDFLIQVKRSSKQKIIPILFIIDLSHKINFIPSLFWDNSLAVLDSAVAEDVFVLTIARIAHWKLI